MKRGVVALALLLSARVAAAEGGSKHEEAKRAFAAGNQAYEAGHFLAAARAYENAYELEPLPSITFSAAQAYRRHYYEDPELEWLEKAEGLYRRYLAEEPTGSRRTHAITHLGNIALLRAGRAGQERTGQERTGQERTGQERKEQAASTELLISSTTPHATAAIDGTTPERVPVVRQVAPGSHRVKVSAPGFFEAEVDTLAVEGRLGIVPVELKPRPASLRVLSPAGSDVWIDGRIAGPSPLRAPLELPAGHHSVFVSANGHRPISRSVNLALGQQYTLIAHLALTNQRRAAYWTLGGAGAFALAGVATGIVALVSEAEVKDARSSLAEGKALTPSELTTSNRALERRDLFRTLSIASFSVSAAAGVTGTLLFVLDNPAPATSIQDKGAGYGVRFRGVF